MTGLETAIILIAFVTVASVLAYSVLSAGIFSAEKAKETITKGIDTSSNTIRLSSDVLGLSPNGTKLESVQFLLGLTNHDEIVDTRAIVVNYMDSETHGEGCVTSLTLAPNATERGSSYVMENDEQFVVNVTLPASANLTADQTFTIQVLPPKGGAVSITRTMPGSLSAVMDLK